MLHPRARWTVGEADAEAVERLVNELGLEPLLAKLLVVRGIRDAAAADLFIHTQKASFHDPYLMDGMDHAVRRIRQALERREKIRIYGDYDADGVSSTALMIGVMRELGADFDWYIPHRVQEGYGLNNGALDHAQQSGVSLIVTVDTGISAREEVRYAAEIGLDVVVTDHHEPPELLPDAVAVINPKKIGCPYPFKQLAGVGVAFKLAHALLERVPEELLEIATIGTVADLMPLLGENRQIVKLGLERMRKSAYAGIRALLQVGGVDSGTVNAGHVGFALAPRINAGGRLECANDAVELLTTGNDEEAERLALSLDLLNKERQRLVDDMAKEALQMAEAKPDRGVLVLAQEGWNVGVIGIVASKVLDKFYCPTLVLGIDPDTGTAKGSARSIAGFDIHKALTHCADLLDHYGGHQAAAGMSLHRDRIPELEKRLLALAAEWLKAEDYVPIVRADIACSLDEVPLDTIRKLDTLAPFGMGNPPPKFVFTGMQLGDIRTMGKEQQHIKLQLLQAQEEAAAAIDAVGFGRSSAWLEKLSPTAQVDVVGELSINEWNGVRKPQMIVQDLRVLQPQVFDWRGAHDADKRWLRLVERHFAEAPQGSDDAQPGILVFAAAEAAALPAALHVCGCAVWVWEAGAARPLNAAAEVHPFALCRDLFVYSLPPSPAALEQSLAAAASVERVYASFKGMQTADAAIPTRDMFKFAYTALQQQQMIDRSDERMLHALSKRSGLSKTALSFIIEVFEELEFIERDGSVYRCAVKPAKRELTASCAYQARLLRQEAERTLVYSSAQELTRWVLTRVRAE